LRWNFNEVCSVEGLYVDFFVASGGDCYYDLMCNDGLYQVLQIPIMNNIESFTLHILIMRRLFSFFAKRIYKQHFLLLKENLESCYFKLEINNNYEVSSCIEKLLISAEDHRFRYHIGFDVIAILRAFRNRVFYNKYEGASTIEQQVVRVLINRFERTPQRKIREIFLATTLCYIVPRKKIPLIYLHIAYYGTNYNGLNEVVKKYNFTSTDYIPIEIAADIVARIKYPEPKGINLNRLKLIDIRKKHIIKLYYKHSKRRWFKIYDK
jgi:Transglycosylase